MQIPEKRPAYCRASTNLSTGSDERSSSTCERSQFSDGIQRFRFGVLRQQRDEAMHTDVGEPFDEFLGHSAARRDADFGFTQLVAATPSRLCGAQPFDTAARGVDVHREAVPALSY